ncbi:MAG: hypothetical protein HKN47_19150 [Pirellulaceae bacterium]|nr:hypothetical protein [Pirellulaceae bacterium]
MKARKTLAAINKALETEQETGHRKHLGASIVGKNCRRQIWYIFRWFKREKFEGRMLRLFERGHREEKRIHALLKAAGVTVWDVNPDTGEQFRAKSCDGHFGGSGDGMLYNVPDIPGEYALLECKTHNEKSYRHLCNNGLSMSKVAHFEQLQWYMAKLGVKWCLYIAVNKNDDDIFPELIPLQPDVAARLDEKGASIIYSKNAPPRVNKSPGYFECKWCHFREICHYNEQPERNCRTCQASMPIEDGKWWCQAYTCELSDDEQRTGCNEHNPLA